MQAKKKPGPTSDLHRVLFVPDCHHPNADETAWKVLLSACSYLKPHTLCILGDFVDMESVSMHEPDEVRHANLAVEAALARCRLGELEAACGRGLERKIYIEGNHEQRLQRYLARQAPALWDMVTAQDLLHLDDSWEWVPYRKSTRIGKLHVTHDTGRAGMNAHRDSAKAFHASAIIGHTHRMAYDVTGTFDGQPYLAAMFGWLGAADRAASYTHEANSANWVHGFGVGHMEANGVVHVQPVPIVSGKCVVSGKLIGA